jgi:hypothetical protein
VPLWQSLAPHAAAPTLTLTRHPWVPLACKTVREREREELRCASCC